MADKKRRSSWSSLHWTSHGQDDHNGRNIIRRTVSASRQEGLGWWSMLRAQQDPEAQFTPAAPLHKARAWRWTLPDQPRRFVQAGASEPLTSALESTTPNGTTLSAVVGVQFVTSDGNYGIGAQIVLSVEFSKAVFVDTTNGTPTLALNSGGLAIYSGGNGTTTLLFTYTVERNDLSPDLDQLSSSALQLNGATIQDDVGTNAVLILANPGELGSLEDSANLEIDGSAPTGTLGLSPSYAAPLTNPYGLSGVGLIAKPALADIDGDGDLDVAIGNVEGNTVVFMNTAEPGATAPAYAAPLTNPYGISRVGQISSPAFGDFDGDGDLDLAIGNNVGDTLIFLNTAEPGATAPAYAAPSTNPYGISRVGFSASPAFADIDGDDDLDLAIRAKRSMHDCSNR